jgi:transposase-like protein
VSERRRRWTEDELRQAFAFVDGGQSVTDLAKKHGLAMTQAYGLITRAEKFVGRRARRAQRGTRATKQVGWTSGRVSVDVCTCDSCVAAIPERAKFRKSA